MGDFNEFSWPVRLFLKGYQWRRIDPVPWTTLAKPLAQSKIALVSSAGFVLPSQAPFDETIRGGDSSFREIPSDSGVRHLVDTHRSESFDHAGLAADPNLAFPLERLKELSQEGKVGPVNHRHISFMGSITAPGRFVRDTVPEVARILIEDKVEAVFLVPV